MTDELRFIFTNVNNWLKFAEAKNGALLAGNIAIIFGIWHYSNSASPPNVLKYYFIYVTALLTLSTLCALISFSPRTQIPFIFKVREPADHDNLLFYGDIAKYSYRVWLEKLYIRYGKTLNITESIEIDYAEQIIINSQIALWKYRWFKFALSLAISSLLTPVIAIPLVALR
jgi:hypothetical protein